MVAVMAFPARYNYLYRIEAHWRTLINALLRFAAPSSCNSFFFLTGN
jgi:hypothetical protein